MKTIVTNNSIFLTGTIQEVLKKLRKLLEDGNTLITDVINKQLN